MGKNKTFTAETRRRGEIRDRVIGRSGRSGDGEKVPGVYDYPSVEILRELMNILMTGATGLVGTALVQAFTAEGHVIYRLVRPGSTRNETISGVFDIPWNPATGEIRGFNKH